MGGKKRLGELEKLMYNEESDRSTSISGSPLKADSLRVSAFFLTTNLKTIPCQTSLSTKMGTGFKNYKVKV